MWNSPRVVFLGVPPQTPRPRFAREPRSVISSSLPRAQRGPGGLGVEPQEARNTGCG